MKNQKLNAKIHSFGCGLSVCLLIGAGIGLLGYHYFLKPEATPSIKQIVFFSDYDSYNNNCGSNLIWNHNRC
ncbi:MAG: hypothetical protein QMD22_08755 [archaeon]|nr:hypothetical protein [archaeon]